jgi:hypothetical protein
MMIVFTTPQRSTNIAGLVFQYLLIAMYSFHQMVRARARARAVALALAVVTAVAR